MGSQSCRYIIKTLYVMFHCILLTVDPCNMTNIVMILFLFNTGFVLLRYGHSRVIFISRLVLLMNTSHAVQYTYTWNSYILFFYPWVFVPTFYSGHFHFLGYLLCSQQTNVLVESFTLFIPSFLTALKWFCQIIFSQFSRIPLTLHSPL